MNQDYKELIQSNFVVLCKKLKLDEEMLSLLMDLDVISECDYEELKESARSNKNSVFLNKLLRKVNKRVWDTFIGALWTTHQTDLIDILMPYSTILTKEGQIQCYPTPEMQDIRIEGIREEVSSNLLSISHYALDSADNLKVTLMIDRGEIYTITTQLEHLFQAMGKSLDPNENMDVVLSGKKSDIINKLDNDMKDNTLGAKQCYFFIFLYTAGSMSDIHTKDNETITYTTILEYFSESKCHQLRGKPKILMFVLYVDAEFNEQLAKITAVVDGFLARNDANDFLICVVPIRFIDEKLDDNQIDWFIYDFVQIMIKCSYSTDLFSLLELILERRGRQQEKVILRSNLTKKIHFASLYNNSINH